MMTVPQLLMLTATGATKSLTSAGNDAEARLFRNALPNASQTPVGKTPTAVRLMAASPKVSELRVLGALGAIGSVTASRLLTAPSEFVPFSVFWLPQHGMELDDKHWLAGPEVTHVSAATVGEVELDKQVTGGRDDRVWTQRAKVWRDGLVDLEVHVRGAEAIGPLPREIEEVAAVGEF